MSACDNCTLPVWPSQSECSLCEPCKALLDRQQEIQVTPLKRSDLELVLAWRSNPKIYRHFRRQNGPLDWEEHVTWYESRSPDRYDFVIHYGDRRVGVVSLNPNDEVSIYLGDFSAHGCGVATDTLGWLCDRFEQRVPLVAEVHKENESSIQLFERCGFQKDNCDEEWLRYLYQS